MEVCLKIICQKKCFNARAPDFSDDTAFFVMMPNIKSSPVVIYIITVSIQMFIEPDFGED